MEDHNMITRSMNTLVIVLLSFALLGLGGCRSGKKTARNEFGRQIEMPCDERKHRSDGDFIRASQIARSSDLTVAREKAFLVTQERLMKLIENSLRSAARRYANERNISHDFEFGEIYESMIVGSASITAQMLSIACEESFINDNGVFTTAMTLEVSRQQLLDVINNTANQQRYFKLKEDMERFKEIFNEETLRPFER